MRIALLLTTLLSLTASAENLPKPADAPYHPWFRGVRLGGIRFDTPTAAAAAPIKGWLPGVAFAASAGPSMVSLGSSRQLGRYADLTWGASRYAVAERYAPLAGRATQDWTTGVKFDFRF